MNIHNVSQDFFGRTLTIETGKLAKQADGAVVVQYGDTVLLATVVSSKTVKEDQDFFPLTVDYRERFTAAGKFRAGYLKRESKPTQREILTARLTDRPLRPLFQDGFFYEVQIEVMVISADQQNDPDVMSILGASAALGVSSIPFSGPVGGVRVGRIDGKYVINPTMDQRVNSDIDIVLAGSDNGILMVEGSAQIISEKELLEVLDVGFEAIKDLLILQKKLFEKVNLPKDNRALFPVDKSLIEKIKSVLPQAELREALYTKGKAERSQALANKYEKIVEKIKEQLPEVNEKKLKDAYKEVQKEVLRRTILTEGVRADGRSLTSIRDIWVETGYLPRTHGSAVFTRGETQALAVATLGGGKDVERSEELGADVEKSFYLHYTFPGYSVGEVKPSRGPGRREIGHGELAERALTAVIPKKNEFPYVIRVTSDILESNGSSSMATVCAGSLSLMDAGVPINASVAGIAMGLIKEESDVAVLSDILGLEDALGDMDFKVAGTRDGISAVQMDIKVEGITREIMEKALEQAKAGRLHILNIMDSTLSSPRSLSVHAPRILHLEIPMDKIGTVIGPGGKMIRALSEKYHTSIDISDNGMVTVKGDQSELVEKCRYEIEMLTAELEVGKTYKGIVKTIVPFGAFIEALPGKEGLLHISRISHKRINKVNDVLQVGQEVEIKCIEFDDRGRPVFSRKDLIPEDQE